MRGDIPMSSLTIRLPDDKHERLKALARANSISINKQMDELQSPNYRCRGLLPSSLG